VEAMEWLLCARRYYSAAPRPVQIEELTGGKVTVRHTNCPGCRLSIRVRSGQRARAECPRCRAHADLAIPLYEKPRPLRSSNLDPTTPGGGSRLLRGRDR
jgi:hypothetical protein